MNRAIKALLIYAILHCICFRVISAGIVELKNYSLTRCAEACLQSHRVSCKYFKFVNATKSCYLSEHNHGDVNGHDEHENYDVHHDLLDHHHHHIDGTTEGSPDKVLAFLWEKYHLIHAKFKQLEKMQHTVEHMMSSKEDHHKKSEHHFTKLTDQAVHNHKRLTWHDRQIQKLFKEGAGLTKAMIKLHEIQMDIRKEIEVVRHQGLGQSDKRIIQGNFDRVSSAINALYRQMRMVEHTKRLMVEMASSLQGKFEQVKDSAEYAKRGVMKMHHVMGQVDDKIHSLDTDLHKVAREAVATRSKLHALHSSHDKMNIITNYIFKLGKILASRHVDYTHMVLKTQHEMQDLHHQLAKQKQTIHHMMVLLKKTSSRQEKMAIPEWKNRLAELEKRVASMNSRIRSNEVNRHEMYHLLVKIAQQLNNIDSQYKNLHGVDNLEGLKLPSYSSISSHKQKHYGEENELPSYSSKIRKKQKRYGEENDLLSDSSRSSKKQKQYGEENELPSYSSKSKKKQKRYGEENELPSYSSKSKKKQKRYGENDLLSDSSRSSKKQKLYKSNKSGQYGKNKRKSYGEYKKKRTKRYKRSLVPKSEDQHIEKRNDDSNINTDDTNGGINQQSNVENLGDAHAMQNRMEKSVHRNKRQVMDRPTTIKKSVTSRRVHGRAERQQSGSDNFMSLLLSKQKEPRGFGKQTNVTSIERYRKITPGSRQNSLEGEPSVRDKTAKSTSRESTKPLKKQQNNSFHGNRRMYSINTEQTSSQNLKKRNKSIRGNRRKMYSINSEQPSSQSLKKQHDKGNRRNFSRQSKYESASKHSKQQNNIGAHGNRRNFTLNLKKQRRNNTTQSKPTPTKATKVVTTTISKKSRITAKGSKPSTPKVTVSPSTRKWTVTKVSVANVTKAHNRTEEIEATESKRYWSENDGYTDCPAGFEAARAKKMYCFVTAAVDMSYGKASDYCDNKTGILVSVESEDKQQALINCLSGSGFGTDATVWLSPTTTGNLWVWQSNMYPIKYLNFQMDKVSRLHQCNVFNMVNSKWQNVSCNAVVRNSTTTLSNAHRVVCEPYVAEMKAANLDKAGQMSLQDQNRLLDTTTTTTTAATVIQKVWNFFGGKRSLPNELNDEY